MENVYKCLDFDHFFCAFIYINRTATQSDDTFTDVIYNKPYCRITPYLVGMLLGYVIYKYPRKSIKLHWVRSIGTFNRIKVSVRV